MKFPIYQVDAFAQSLFMGNPAAVVILTDWLDDQLLLNISNENNLAETAFLVEMPDYYEIRWFSPKKEVDLCGHATLAAAYVVLDQLKPNKDSVTFISEKSGLLKVEKKGCLYELDFPADEIEPVNSEYPKALLEGLGTKPLALYKGKTDCMVLLKDEKSVKNLNPDICKFQELDYRGIIVTAPGDDVDFVSRFFAPNLGIPEDPVTGSAHTTLVPYWHSQNGNIEFTATQLSERGGVLQCIYMGDRIRISGTAYLYMKGEISIC